MMQKIYKPLKMYYNNGLRIVSMLPGDPQGLPDDLSSLEVFTLLFVDNGFFKLDESFFEDAEANKKEVKP